MSINISQIFTQIGRAVAWTNTLVSDQNSIYLAATTGMADNILSQFNSSRALVPNLQSSVKGYASAMAGQAAQTKTIADVVLASLQGPLNAPNSRPATILPLLNTWMIANNATIKASVPTAITIAANGVASTGVTTGLVTADTYSQGGTHLGFPYWQSNTLGTQVFIWWNGTNWIMSTAVGTPGSDYFTSAGSLITSAYTATGGSGTPVVSGGNATNDILVTSFLNSQGSTDQRITNGEVVQITCTSSQYSGGTAGAESWSVVGQPVISPSVYGQQGNGTTTLVTADLINKVQNGNFETWAVTNTPNNWTTVGTIGTNIKENTANPHSGTACVELDGDGTTATISLTQIIAPVMQTGTVYACSVWLRKSGTVTSGSTLAIEITGTGFTTQVIHSLDPNTLTTAYQQYTLFFSMPNTAGNSVPANLSAVASWTSANSAGGSAVILIDDFVIAPATNFGNVQLAVFRGSTDPIVGDGFNYTSALTSAGVFQNFFAEWYDVMLNSSATPSLSDSLAT